MYGGNADVFAYPSTSLPNGTIEVHGSAGGLSFPLNVHPSTRLSMFDATFNRPLNVSFTGGAPAKSGLEPFSDVNAIKLPDHWSAIVL